MYVIKLFNYTNAKMREHLGVITNEKSVWHVGKFFAILIFQIHGRCHLVSNYVIHEGCT